MAMPEDDALRWDARYLGDERFATFAQARPFLVENARYLPAQGLALDVAMGLGGNAAFLLERGLRVVGVDVSSVAVRRAKNRLPELMAVIADLRRISLPVQALDVILNFYYLQRDLWPQYASALRPGGVLIFETLMRQMAELQPNIDPTYLLAPGELRQAFADWKIEVYREGWRESRSGSPFPVASMVARKAT